MKTKNEKKEHIWFLSKKRKCTVITIDVITKQGRRKTEENIMILRKQERLIKTRFECSEYKGNAI